MSRLQFQVGELVLGILFAGVYAAFVAASAREMFPLLAIVMGGMILGPIYLLALVMLRQRRGK